MPRTKLDDELDEWAEARALHLIKVFEWQSKSGDVSDLDLFTSLPRCPYPKDGIYNELFSRLTEESQWLVLERALRELKSKFSIGATRTVKMPLEKVYTTGRSYIVYYKTLDVLDAIVAATTPPKLLTLKPERFGW